VIVAGSLATGLVVAVALVATSFIEHAASVVGLARKPLIVVTPGGA
jgi:hypothetical protein